MAVTSDPTTAAVDARDLLTSAFPGRVAVPDDAQYQSEKDQPWCQTCWLPAACFVRPSSMNDVAEILKIVRQTGTKFAVRCGGHNTNPGGNSIDGNGILVNLLNLKSLELADDAVLRVGAGCIWGDVYDFLDKKGLSAIGGRQRDVGVSGYLLGGGMPAFPNHHGLAADSVKNFEVVLADSTIVNANANENPDLFRALKGGGSNFGIVTRFDIQTYPLIEVKYTVFMYDPSGYDEVLRATAEAQTAMEVDSKIGMFTAVNPAFIAVGAFYLDTEAAQPKFIETFFNLKSLQATAVPTTKGTLKTLIEAIGILGPAARRLAYTTTTKVSYDLYIDIHNLWLEGKTKYPGVNLWYSIQPASPATAQIGEDRGGNSLGLEKVSQSWWAIVAEWPDETGDAAAAQALKEFTEDVINLAKKKGKHLDFIFMNDAHTSQNVLGGYGAENLKRLRDAAAKYDPEGVFQKLQNDGFLLRKV
ncbi:6-hydroxy-D-nicotine oxidase [Hypoxylon trugodes]|uniref:6-hydroxy-D-nicotine oxidase n=1 Tax=Hypoxylon trugodes TaxID=326681 RepID=UPI002198235A|nr:6-hydroxy-D-nicotine oxidase [Hypoxylon trugodes]KAI1387334.1 6-hydroxy-D-nicotine oxidase [Hypoxylon trugodes]